MHANISHSFWIHSFVNYLCIHWVVCWYMIEKMLIPIYVRFFPIDADVWKLFMVAPSSTLMEDVRKLCMKSYYTYTGKFWSVIQVVGLLCWVLRNNNPPVWIWLLLSDIYNALDYTWRNMDILMENDRFHNDTSSTIYHRGLEYISHIILKYAFSRPRLYFYVCQILKKTRYLCCRLKIFYCKK